MRGGVSARTVTKSLAMRVSVLNERVRILEGSEAALRRAVVDQESAKLGAIKRAEKAEGHYAAIVSLIFLAAKAMEAPRP